MQWQIATASDIGGRFEQQDRCAAFSAADGHSHLLVVADGMGGHSGGALAAQAVIDTAAALWPQQSGETPAAGEDFLARLSARSHRRIGEIGARDGISPHSTCALLYLCGNLAWWGHIGDSRLYYFREGRLHLRTRDHSVVQMLFELGRIQEHEMASHPEQGHLLRGLGGSEVPTLDLGQAVTRPGDVFVVCSDGLWEQFEAAEMLRYLTPANGDLSARITRLVTAAMKRGGESGDNVAAAVALHVA